MKKRGLTAKQARFVEEYLRDSNGTQAAARAGFSRKSAARQAVDLLHNPHVRAQIEKRQAKIQEQTGDTVERIIRELQEHRERAMEIGDLGAANRAVELRGKHLKMFADRTEHDIGESLLDLLTHKSDK